MWKVAKNRLFDRIKVENSSSTRKNQRRESISEQDLVASLTELEKNLTALWSWLAWYGDCFRVHYLDYKEGVLEDMSITFEAHTSEASPSLKPGFSATPIDIYDALFEQFGRWMRRDMSFHDQRESSNELSFKPPGRLIEIPDSKECHVRCISTQSWSSCKAYIAISHRWPSFELFKHTVANSLKLQSENGVHISVLAPVFQEAVKIARKLGITYIWIDSLCIIQDDPEDWASEAGKMADVYSNTVLTISFDLEPEAGVFPFDSLVNWVASSISKGRREYFMDVFGEGDMETKISRSPLDMRGWCFQERALSKRVLHIFPTCVIWEQAGQNRQRFLGLRKPSIDLRHDRSSLVGYTVGDETLDRILARRPDSARSRRSPEYIWSTEVGICWKNCLREYTRRSLTDSKDRLAAFSAIARKFQEYTGDTYLLGCFLSCLPQSLSWYTLQAQSGPKNTRLNAEKSRIPTWTFGSVTGEIRYDDPLFESRGYLGVDLALTRLYHTSGAASPGNLQDTLAVSIYGMLIPATLRLVNSQYCVNFDDGQYCAIFEPEHTDEGAVCDELDIYWVVLLYAREDIHEDGAVYRGISKQVLVYTGLLLRESVRYTGAYERHGLVYIYERLMWHDFYRADAFQQRLHKKELENGIDLILV